MDLLRKISYLLLVVSPIVALPDLDSFNNQLSEPWVSTIAANPLKLNDLEELEDVTPLEYLAEITINETKDAATVMDLDSKLNELIKDLANITKTTNTDTSTDIDLDESSGLNKNLASENHHISILGPIYKLMCPASVLGFNGRKDVRYILYNKRYPLGVDVTLKFDDNMLMPNTPIKFVIHGFLNGESSEMCQTVKNAYMSRTDNHNVIIVDWSKGSGTWLSNYFKCFITSRIVPSVGEAVANFIVKLINEKNVSILSVNVIGHSLGAQISGFAGKHLIERGHKLPVIVGLDPALPEFKNLNESERLCPNDAEYVEVIHTNGGALGFEEPLGTADFYPNFRSLFELMPGCFTSTCSHARSFRYFANSIESPSSFKATRCDSFAALSDGMCNGSTSYMGGNDIRADKPTGIFYLTTKSKAPYGQS